jgi:hypothetical protein
MRSLTFLLITSLPLSLAQNRPPQGSFGVISSNTDNRATGSLSAGLPHAEAAKGGSTTPGALMATGGSGCKADSVVTNFNADGTILSLLFSEFAAAIGPNIALQENRRFCSVATKLKVPAGWTLQVEHVDWRGYVDLDRGVRGEFSSSLFWSERRDDRVRFFSSFSSPSPSLFLPSV